MNAKLHAKLRKLVTLALAPSATEAESSAAWTKALRACRDNGIDPDSLATVLSPAPKPENPAPDHRAPPADWMEQSIRSAVESSLSSFIRRMTR